MKTFFRLNLIEHDNAEEDYTPVSLQESIEKTRKALDIAYTGFDNVTDFDLIDSYIYEINSLLKRYSHLTQLAAKEIQTEDTSRQYSAIRSLVSHVFG